MMYGEITTLTKEKLNLAGWCAVTSGVITIPSFMLWAFLDSHPSSGADVFQATLTLIGLALFIYIFSSLLQLLNIRFDFHDTDVLINLLIWINIGAAILNLLVLLVSRLEALIGALLVIALVAFGLIYVAFGVRLLRFSQPLFGLLKPFSYMSIVTGICFATIVLIPVGLMTSAIADVILGIIFFRAAENM